MSGKAFQKCQVTDIHRAQLVKDLYEEKMLDDKLCHPMYKSFS